MTAASRCASMHALKGARSCELEPVMGAAGLCAGPFVVWHLSR
jgi:hypothetical protein